MKDLYIKQTEFTPEIHFEVTGHFLIGGVSRPEDVIKFYDIPLNWIAEFKENLVKHVITKYRIPKLQMNFKMKYMNSASAKCILQILQILKEINVHGIEVMINWYYDEADDQMLEDGEDLSDAVDLPFNYGHL